MFKKVLLIFLTSFLFHNTFGSIYENYEDDLGAYNDEQGVYPSLECILVGNRTANARNRIILSFSDSEIVKVSDLGLQSSNECYLQPSMADFDVVLTCFGRSLSEEMSYLIREDATGIVIHPQMGQVAEMECALVEVIEKFDEDYYKTHYGDNDEDFENGL